MTTLGNNDMPMVMMIVFQNADAAKDVLSRRMREKKEDEYFRFVATNRKAAAF